MTPEAPTAPADVAADAQAAPGPAAVVGPPPRSLTGIAVVGFVVLGLTALLVIGYLFIALGASVVAIGGVMALIPLSVVLLGVRWIDRWEPEPRSILLFAFLWGASTAVFVALVVGLVVEGYTSSKGWSQEATDFYGAVFQAPIVEELAKGFGVLLIFLVARKHFDGPVDGIVYAATVAAGFAFTENILYFGAELLNSSGSIGGVIGVFVVRGIMSPFAHAMFTLCTGLALGIASRRTGRVGAIGAFIVGLIPAMLLHALWNGSTFVVGDNFFPYYLAVQVPLFVAAIIIVVRLRKSESRVTRERLAEYAAAGWFNPDEVSALATPVGRRQALSWARQHGLRPVMKGYIQDATRLAFVRQRLVTGKGTTGAQADEAAALASILVRRAQLRLTA